jgi:hypothetical protein
VCGLGQQRVEMTLWTFCQSVLLTFNAFAILNEQRFLDKYGLGERRVRAERERARAAHRGHHRDAVRTGAARGAERAGDIRQDGLRIDSAGLVGCREFVNVNVRRS